jgi:hypothetical protein
MTALLKVVAVIVTLFAAAFVLQIVASESGEVVVITTRDATGIARDTRLWVVDHDGSAWLRSGSTTSGWYQRLIDNPKITIQRSDTSFTAIAEPRTEVKATIDGLMNDKYGWADDYIGMLYGRGGAVPIRLLADASSE